jgi:hypothetical protein
MNSTAWLRHFENNRLDRPEPLWDLPCTADPATAAQLARSLSHFQLGESGEGSFLLAEGRRTHPDDPDYVQALGFFVAEEQEHARLLEHLVTRFGGTLVTRHWTHACFRLLRRALGVHFEIQVLVIAEIVGTAYYRLLRTHTVDAVLEQVCVLMLGDETRHLQFHADRFADWQAAWPKWGLRLWAGQFRLVFAAAVGAAWLDHRLALTALGATREDFLVEAGRHLSDFLARVEPAGGPGRLTRETFPSES